MATQTIKTFQYIKKNGTVSWGFYVYLGWNDIKGKKDQIRRSGYETRREASESAKKLIASYNANNETLIYGRQTYEDVYNLWIVQYERLVKPSTLNRALRDYKNHILPIFGAMRIDKISPALCQKTIEEWSKKFVKYTNIKSYFSKVFDYALKLDIIKRNPLDRVVMPRSKRNIRQNDDYIYYTRTELRSFLTALDAENEIKWRAFFRLAAYSGARKGELLALTWQDIDFRACEIIINKTIAHGRGNKIIIQSPKTSKSIRVVSLDKETMHILKEWKMAQSSLGKSGIINFSGLVFTSAKGGYINPPKPGKCWIGFVRNTQ